MTVIDVIMCPEIAPKKYKVHLKAVGEKICPWLGKGRTEKKPCTENCHWAPLVRRLSTDVQRQTKTDKDRQL